MYSLDDTIAAISTPIGEGGIGIVRLSGPEALPIVEKIFAPGGNKRPGKLRSYRLHYGHIFDPESGEIVDEVLVSYMHAPHTYTRQDVVEINCHGGIVPLRRVLELVLRYGARLAQPGEMTLRAFLNGRIDLAQAEAVLDIVRARTEASLRVALSQLEGHLSGEIRTLRACLLEALAYLEASLDFVEDEIPFRDLVSDLEEAERKLKALLSEADRGAIYRQGVRAAIVGRPNVGKSSLLNALLRTNRAIVTPIPGTTRDTLEETLNLRGVPLVLVDTAGITVTEDLVERLGIERSRQALSQADLALMVLDGSEPLTQADREIASLIRDKAAIVVINKIDLPRSLNGVDFLPQAPRVEISALRGDGLEKLEETILERILGGEVWASEVPLVSNPRHKSALYRALEHVQAARQAQREGLPADFVAIDLRGAVNALGEITGESVEEDLLETIFANFCLGK